MAKNGDKVSLGWLLSLRTNCYNNTSFCIFKELVLLADASVRHIRGVTASLLCEEN